MLCWCNLMQLVQPVLLACSWCAVRMRWCVGTCTTDRWPQAPCGAGPTGAGVGLGRGTRYERGGPWRQRMRARRGRLRLVRRCSLALEQVDERSDMRRRLGMGRSTVRNNFTRHLSSAMAMLLFFRLCFPPVYQTLVREQRAFSVSGGVIMKLTKVLRCTGTAPTCVGIGC